METWFIVIVSLCIAASLKALFNFFNPNTGLPPGPLSFPIIGNFLLHRKSPLELHYFVQTLLPKYGPMITLNIYSNPTIFISDRGLAHQALIQTGAVFADRPSPSNLNRNRTTLIGPAGYGPTWRLLRRNLTAEILHHSRLYLYSNARKQVLQILLDCFNAKCKSGEDFRLIDHFQSALYSLVVLMCFGDKLDQKKSKEIEDVQCRLMLSSRRFSKLNFWPRLTKVLFRKQNEEFLQIRQQQDEVLMPMIEERQKTLRMAKLNVKEEVNDEWFRAYVDTLFDLQLPEEKRKLTRKEIMSLSSEFLLNGAITTSTTLQWTMANLVKYPHIQEKLLTEIKGVVGDAATEVQEDDLLRMPYLKAVILETLRLHPPVPFLAPHAVTEDVVLNGFLVPKKASIYFLVADMGWDSKVWDDSMTFKPERFLSGEEFDITGSREIKMMPFGVGRRICPGIGLATLHLEYFVANFIWNFEWKTVDGDMVSLEEKQEIVTVMKNPLQVHLNPRLP